MEFSIIHNVKIQVVDEKRHMKQKEVKVHNKASRRFVVGILRFIMGNFTYTDINKESIEYPEGACDYIPCYVGFGHQGIVYGEDGKPEINPNDSSGRTPVLVENYDQNTQVQYKDTSLDEEFNLLGADRPKIAKVSSTIYSDGTVADMDTVTFRCKLGPGNLSPDNSTNSFVSEVGLFPTKKAGSKDILAHVKLKSDEILFVRPQDTVLINWSITIASIGRDSTFTDSSGDTIQVFPSIRGGVTVL